MGGKNGAVHPLVAAVIIVFFAILLLAWFWAREQLHAIPEPAHLASMPDGRVLARFGDKAYPVEEDGTVGASLSLSGASRRVGFAVERNALFLYRDGAGVLRCEWRNERCKPFLPSLNLPDTARLLWDDNRKHLWVTDTTVHQLRSFDSNGQARESLSGFLYPNGLTLGDDLLIVADTNHHRLAAVSLKTPEKVRTVVEIEPAVGYRWPTAVAVVGQEYWVVVGDSRLENQRLYRYGNDGQLLGRAATSLADMSMVAPLGEGALVVDRESKTLWRLNDQGQLLAELVLPGSNWAIQERNFWRHWVNGLLIFLVVSLIAGVAFAWWHDRDRLPDILTGDDLSRRRGEVGTAPSGEVWLKHAAFIRLRYIYLCLPLMLLAAAWLLGTLGPLPDDILWLGGALMVLFLPLGPLAFWLLDYVSRSGVGVHGSLLLLRSPDGQVVVGSGSQVAYAPSMLVIDDVVMPMGTAALGLFDRTQVRDWVAPQLAGARKIKGYEALLVVWRRRFWPLILLYGLFGLGILAGMVYLVSRGMS